jgi:hypothetical protein
MQGLAGEGLAAFLFPAFQPVDAIFLDRSAGDLGQAHLAEKGDQKGIQAVPNGR